jgi:hypothetical protein
MSSFRSYHLFQRAVGAAKVPGTLVSADPATVTSIPTSPRRDGLLSIEISALAGGSGLAGTFTLEFSQSTEDEIRRGVDTWAAYTPNDNSNAAAKSIPAISLTGTQSVSHLLELVDVSVARLRVKFVRSGNSGTVYARARV